MQRRVFLAFAVLLCLPVVAQSAVIIVGHNLLLPNTANQRVNVLITGGEAVNGGDLAASVGSGNQVLTPAAAQEPAITAADIIGSGTFNATIFTGNNTTQSVSGAPGATKRTIEVGTTTSIDLNDPNPPPNFYSATATGQFGTLVFNTTGIFAGTLDKTWALKLGGHTGTTVPIFGGSDSGTDQDTNTIFINVTDGDVYIKGVPIPEPSSIVLGLFAAAGLAAVAIRRRRRA